MSKRRDQFTGVPADFVRQLQAALARADARLEALERDPGRAGIVLRSTSADAGQLLNIEAPAGGLTILLPESTAALRNERVTLAFRNENPVKIEAVRGTVNRETFVVNTAVGTFEAVADGLGGWSVETGLSSSGSPSAALAAQYVLGAANALLPNAAVAADTTEIDVTVTPGGTATWALRDGSVTLDRLEDIPDQRVLGNDAGVDGPPEPITVHQELDWVSGDALWKFDGIDDRVTIGDFNDQAVATPFSVSSWVQTPSVAAQQVIIGKLEGASGFRGWEFGLENPGRVYLFLCSVLNVGTNLIIGETGINQVPVGALTHVVATYNGNGLRTGVTIYINGVPIALDLAVGLAGPVSGSTDSTASLTMGWRGSTSTFPFTGRMPHTAVWTGTALSAAQVLEVYNAGTPPDLLNLATTPDPTLWIKLDSADTVAAGGIHDYGTGSHNGTAAGGLVPGSLIGSVLSRSTAIWQTIPPGASGLAFVANGDGVIPSYRQIGTNGMPSYGVESFLGNFTAASAVPTARAGSSVAGAGLTYAAGGTLAVGSSTSITVNADDVQRSALTGAITASVNSNATAFGVLAAKSVLANATNGSAIPAALAGSAAFQHLRVNSANTALEWAVLSAGDFPAGAVPLTGLATQAANTIVANATAGVASPTAVAVSADSLLARVGGNLVTHPWSTLAGASLDYAAGVIDYAGTTAEIVNSTATGNLGTIDISSLVCGGTYRVSAASSAYSIEGFTAKSQGFWFTFISEDTVDRVTLFNEDATATATNRLALPGQKDATAIQMRMGFCYNGSRWSGLSDNPSAIGTATNFAEVSAVGTPVINLTTASGAINITSGAAVNIDATGSLNLDADVNVVVTAGSLIVSDASGDGFIIIDAGTASTPSVSASQGMLWVNDPGASSTLPMFTGDDNVDHVIVTEDGPNLVFTGSENKTNTGATVNDYALGAGTRHLRWGGGTGADTLTGMSGGVDGRVVWIANIDGTLADTLIITHEGAGSAAANRFVLEGQVSRVLGSRGMVQARYDGTSSRWFIVG